MYFFRIFVLFICLLRAQAEENPPENCEEGTLQLSLHGIKKDDVDQWNVTYELERSSCQSAKKWNLNLYQNVTDHGKTKKMCLKGYFSEMFPSTNTSDSLPQLAEELTTYRNDTQNTMTDSDSNGNCEGTNFKEAKTWFKIISRSEWGAKPSNKTLKKLVYPMETLGLYYFLSNCWNYSTCVHNMQKLQETKMSTLGDINGSFHVSGDGRIYEGTGWEWSIYDDRLYLEYHLNETATPSAKQLAAMASFIHEGIKLGKISSNYTLTGNQAEITKEWLDWMISL